ncbi:UNVERIFIED_ORG: hypothetical protein LHJ69_12790 [Shinella sp. XGS7]|nr:hypothetical protein [Shinella sp. XGS7]
MSELEELQQEVAELREAVRLLIAVVPTVVAITPDAAEATKALAAALQDAERAKPRSDTFWELASGVMKMLSSKALQLHPEDEELRHIHHGVRQAPH